MAAFLDDNLEYFTAKCGCTIVANLHLGMHQDGSPIHEVAVINHTDTPTVVDGEVVIPPKALPGAGHQ